MKAYNYHEYRVEVIEQLRLKIQSNINYEMSNNALSIFANEHEADIKSGYELYLKVINENQCSVEQANTHFVRNTAHYLFMIYK